MRHRFGFCSVNCQRKRAILIRINTAIVHILYINLL